MPKVSRTASARQLFAAGKLSRRRVDTTATSDVETLPPCLDCGEPIDECVCDELDVR